LVIPDGEVGAEALTMDANAMDAVRNAFRHCKPLLVVGAGSRLLDEAGIDDVADPAIFRTDAAGVEAMLESFIAAVGAPRRFERETDPPVI
jgi:catalase